VNVVESKGKFARDGREWGRTGKGVLLGSEGGDEGILLFLGWATRHNLLKGLSTNKARYCSLVSFGRVDTEKSNIRRGEKEREGSLMWSKKMKRIVGVPTIDS